MITASGEVNESMLVNKNITDIIIHHTASESENLQAIDNAHKKRKTHAWWVYNQSSGKYPNIDYHYVILKDGTIINTRPEDKVWRATKEHNAWVIHIVLIGNFNNHTPSLSQYETLNKQISILKKKYNIKFIGGHRDVWQTACPWKYFDFGMIGKTIKPLWVRKITQYYSPVPDQKTWLPFEKWYEDSYKRQFNWYWDTTMPADWVRYTDADWLKVVACPWKERLGKKLYIAGFGFVTCRDTGGAIKGKRLDLYLGIWDNAVKRYNTLKGGMYDIYEIK